MKKKYMTPAIFVTKIQLQTIIAASPTGGQVYDTNAESEASGFARGHNSLWDDEESDD